MTTAANPRAFAVWFKDLDRWSVSSFFSVGWNWPTEMIRPLSAALQRRFDVVDRAKAKFADLRLVTLHFGGDLEPRNLNGKKGFKGKLFCARAGDVLYSKIDVRNGAIGIVPMSMPAVAVSAEYPVYRVLADVASPEYIKLLFRTSAFRQKINSMISGASGRKRVQPSDLENIEVPLPPLAVQRAIVRRWQEAQATIAQATARANALEADIGRDILKRLGIQAAEADMLPKVFAVYWKDLERWSVDYLRRNLASGRQLAQAKYPLAALGEIGTVSYGLQKCPGNRPGAHARPYLRVANVQAGRLDLGTVKYIEVPDSEMESFRLKAGDLLVCEGNSADLVGRPAIWNDEIPDCVHQNHILKVRVNGDMALPHYVLEYMHTSPARNYFRSRAKQTTNLASINSNDLRGLPVPLPPLAVQHGIVDMAARKRAEVGRERQAVANVSADVAHEVEEMILGTRPAKA
ncbi:MAG: restriction endonuclease subunit S [Phycisphaerae bacterium]|nr:restriction endonuclease subunit S [Phycisphaerae bacterium]